MKLLFVKDRLAWPRASGHDVHCFHMMEALASLGHPLGLLTAEEPAPEAVAGLPLAFRRSFATATATARATATATATAAAGPPVPLSWLQERFRSYWGIDPARIQAVAQAAEAFSADAVIAVGLEVLPYLGAVSGRQRVWYAADEWAWHHVSQMQFLRPSTWGELKKAAVKGLYERAYRRLLDRVWVVSERDRLAMRWVAGAANIDVIPNGVDGNHYQPVAAPQLPQSCTFWGRLDFGPNIQALEWFCRRVWPLVRRSVPMARFTIYGFNPTSPIRALADKDGIELIADLPDLRGEIARHQAVVLPFVSGGGIKNKLLEAASMGKAILCTPRACHGLQYAGDAPFVVARRGVQWVHALEALWSDAPRREHLGNAARQWVLGQHSWAAAARMAVNGLGQSATRAATPMGRVGEPMGGTGAISVSS